LDEIRPLTEELSVLSPSLEEGEASGVPPVFTIINFVRELVVELNLRSVEAFLRFVERHLG